MNSFTIIPSETLCWYMHLMKTPHSIELQSLSLSLSLNPSIPWAGLELQNAKKDEAIIRLETQVKDLNVRLKELKQSHKVELQEANVRLQQEIYLAKHFKESSGVGTRQPAVKSKQRAKPKSKN